MRVAQLAFAPLGTLPLKAYGKKSGKYWGSTEPDIGRPWEDYEFQILNNYYKIHQN